MDQEKEPAVTQEEFSELNRNLWLALIFGITEGGLLEPETDQNDSENN